MGWKEKLLSKLSDWLGVSISFDRDVPQEEVFKLDDSKGTIYYWKLKPEISEEQRSEIAEKVNTAFVKEYHKDLQSLHLFGTNVEEIRELTEEEVNEFIRPYID